jgi:hypothetical protein
MLDSGTERFARDLNRLGVQFSPRSALFVIQVTNRSFAVVELHARSG